MLSNAYFLAKIRFDTAENEPAKNLQNFANFPDFANFHQVLVQLTKAAAELEETSRQGSTPLFLAAQNGHALAVRYLCHARAETESVTADGSTPKLKGSIGEGSNHSNFSHQSSVQILSKCSCCIIFIFFFHLHFLLF